ncbi:MAG: hypothetical protein GWN58_49920, partial [Anaerolineae bacterium]|nr:hypothetical protein [Anaerolineae bacterium]
MNRRRLIFVVAILGFVSIVLVTVGGIAATSAPVTVRLDDSGVSSVSFTVSADTDTSAHFTWDWVHLSSKNGDLPAPGDATQQTTALILDVDQDGRDDFVIGSRQAGPAMVWYQRNADGWTKYLIDGATLDIEAGGAFGDIDRDGDLDVVMGGDYHSNKVWWWENPYPNYGPDTPWTRREIKNSGSNKHHDQMFGDFD